MSEGLHFSLLQINLAAGSVSRNRALLKRAADGAAIAAEGAPLLCLAPELAISGFPLEKLPLQTGFLELCRAQLEKLAAELKNGPALVLGCPERLDGGLRSSLFLLADGAVTRLGGRPLAQALGYGEERRHTPTGVQHGVFSRFGLSFAVCAGLASLRTPEQLPQSDVVLCLDNEPFETGQWASLSQTCADAARRMGRPLLRVNAVGGNGSYIHPGGSLAADNTGVIRISASPWRQELVVEEIAGLISQAKDDEPANESPDGTSSGMDALGNAILLGIRDYVRKSGFTRVLLGLSGGMDSSLVAALAAEALGADNVTGLLLPSRWSSQGSLDDSAALAANLGIATYTIPITPLMDAYETALAPVFQGASPDLTEENLQARIRANLLMAYSNKFGGLLLSTDNKSEAAVGYGTLYGDLAGGLAPIADIYKTDVYRLARWFNDMKGREIIPQAVFDKAPSAELRPGQTDQDSLPPYDILDSCLRTFFEGENLCEQAVCPTASAEIVQKAAELVRRSEFKRRQAPPALFVSARPLALFARPLPAARVE